MLENLPVKAYTSLPHYYGCSVRGETASQIELQQTKSLTRLIPLTYYAQGLSIEISENY